MPASYILSSLQVLHRIHNQVSKKMFKSAKCESENVRYSTEATDQIRPVTQNSHISPHS